jgi:hypothetical protein
VLQLRTTSRHRRRAAVGPHATLRSPTIGGKAVILHPAEKQPHRLTCTNVEETPHHLSAESRAIEPQISAFSIRQTRENKFFAGNLLVPTAPDSSAVLVIWRQISLTGPGSVPRSAHLADTEPSLANVPVILTFGSLHSNSDVSVELTGRSFYVSMQVEAVDRASCLEEKWPDPQAAPQASQWRLPTRVG